MELKCKKKNSKKNLEKNYYQKKKFPNPGPEKFIKILKHRYG